MANNVYIGSRYVPVFDGDWDSTKTYESLTIVNYNGGSYTSKRTVPAGTLPTNTSYWVLTGNYNGQIAALQQDIADINSDIDDLDTKIDHVNDEIYIVIGDSWSNFYTGNDRYISVIAKAISNGHTYYEDAKGGAGFIGNYGGYTYSDILSAIDSGLTAAQRSLVTNVVVIGGENDGTPNAVELQTAVSSFVDMCVGLYPNCKVTYIHATGTVSKNFNENHRLLPMLTNKRFIFMSGFPNVVVTSNLYQSDGHLASDVRADWCKWLINFYFSRNYQFYKNVNVTSALKTTEMTVSGGTVQVGVRDKEYRLFSNYITINVPNAFRSWEGNALLFEFQNDHEHPCPVIETRGFARLMFSDDSSEIVPVWGTYMSDTGNYGVVMTMRSFPNSNVGTVRVRLDMTGHKIE